MGIQVKICGINSVESADAAVRAGADFAGLVFFRGSPRNLSREQGASLAERMRGHARLVALMVDANDEEVAAVVKAVRPDFLQFHGSESPERVGAVRSQFGVPIVKALAVAEASDLARAGEYANAAEMFLFDAKAPANAARPGGHGAAFDWQLLRGRSFVRPWLLAGGLTSENVARAIASSDAPGVDVSSGVETAPGVKSPQMISDFVAAARSASYAETRT
ncbi:MAG TPA: phosphoribosylanthranilate isomerase [Rhizomicrobium sp.]|jgi:phosphoribosylanthranilate isomerase|nr:phosphoribosylanthranilate isomerase [Rhizomicrobium sp.]